MTNQQNSSWSARLMMFVIVVFSAMSIAGLAITSIPLGVPDEWTWDRIPFSADHLAAAYLIVPATFYIWFVAAVGSRIHRFGGWRQSFCAFVLSLAGAGWIFGVLLVTPAPFGMNRVPYILFYPRSSGYFTQAAEDATDVAEFLKTYEKRISDPSNPDNHLHLGTHPPGLTLCYRGLITLCEQNPALVDLAKQTQPPSVRESFNQIQSLNAGATTTQLAAIWWSSLLTLFSAGFTTWPLFLLCRRSTSATSGWYAAALWPLIPALAVFFPKSDVLYTLFAVLMQWLWVVSLDRKAWLLGSLVGAIMFASLMLTLAFVPIGLMLVIQALFRRKQSLPTLISSAVVFWICIGGFWWLTELNPIEVWLQNFRNHAAFYEHFDRSYLPWLVVNPFELAFAVGIPVTIWAGYGVIQAIRPTEDTEPNNWNRVDLLIAVGIWAFLWLSGKNMGEAARLWIFLMPITIWAAAFSLREQKRNVILAALIAQVVVFAFTVMRVDGFHFGHL